MTTRPIPAHFNRILIDPEAELIVVSDVFGNPVNETFRPADEKDADGLPVFGPSGRYRSLRAHVVEYYLNKDGSRQARHYKDASEVLGVTILGPEGHTVAVPLNAIVQDLGDDPFPTDSGPAMDDEEAVDLYGYRLFWSPVYDHPAPEPCVVLDVQAARIKEAFGHPTASEVHWVRAGGRTKVWAEKSKTGWSVYSQLGEHGVYWSGPLTNPSALMGAEYDAAGDLFRLINNVLVGEASTGCSEDLGVLHVYERANLPRKEPVTWEESYLRLVRTMQRVGSTPR